jgi:hypothetical protein|tara:strand:+ start:258 stop:695 length:438 start_codon:yes stop_codon:yes gene_type:complete
MGTRSVTTIVKDGVPILKMYRQFDGGIEGGMGEELIDFLRGRRVVNGYSQKDEEAKAFNGETCLAASIIAHFKSGIGNVYIQPLDDDYEGAYNYLIEVQYNDDPRENPRFKKQNGKIHIRMTGYNGILYDGFVDTFSLESMVDDD